MASQMLPMMRHLGIATASLGVTTARAETVTLKADLKGSNEVPPNRLAEVTAGYRAMLRLAKIFQSTAADVLARRFKSSDAATTELAVRIAAELNNK